MYVSQKSDSVFIVRVAYMELYNETLYDLLNSSAHLQIREDVSYFTIQFSALKQKIVYQQS